MREDFLYHVWKFQKFKSNSVKTFEGDPIKVIHPGFQNELAGPDFFNAKVQIGDQLWAGNVEMHLKSSDWYFHQHEIDPNYDNVILHVVWENDVEIYRKDNSIIPTLILQDKVDDSIIEAYSELLERDHQKLNCENEFGNFSDFQVQHWLERLYFERLEVKSRLINQLLSETGNNWEAVLFILICRSFGLNVNAQSFMSMAQNLDFKVVQKLGDNLFSLEALFLGQTKLIKEVDQYGLDLQREFEYLKHKFSLENDYLQTPQFFRLRPDNFPTVRLVQLAALYYRRKHLFQDIIKANDLKGLRDIFQIEVSEYWKTHYNFGKNHAARRKGLTSKFIDLILINCIVPIKYCYNNFIGQEQDQAIQDLISGIDLEKNSLIDIYNELRPETAKNAMHSQALIQLRKEYCNMNRCLKCELGASLLRKSPKYI